MAAASIASSRSAAREPPREAGPLPAAAPATAEEYLVERRALLERRLAEVAAKAAADRLEDVRIRGDELKITPLMAVTPEEAETLANRLYRMMPNLRITSLLAVVHQVVDDGDSHRRIGEDLAPVAEGLVGGDQQGSPLVAGADQLEQDAGLGLVLGDIGEVVEDQQVVFIEPGDGRFEGELAAGDLQPLHEIGGAGEQHAPAVFDQGEAGRCRQGRRTDAL